MSKWTLEFIIVNPIAAFREIERLNSLLKRSRDCLFTSIDDLHSAYIMDYRHEMPTRAAQLKGMEEDVDKHESLLRELNTLYPYEIPQ